jgi:hypothetical protein
MPPRVSILGHRLSRFPDGHISREIGNTMR